MIDNIAFNYFTVDSEHILSICEKMRDHDKGPEPFHLTSNTKANPLYPMRVVYYSNNKVLVSGSIHKFWNKADHCNDNHFSLEDALYALNEIYNILKISPSEINPKITRLELGVNIKTPLGIENILKSVSKYKSYNFKYTEPKSGGTKIWGKKVTLSDYTIKLYNKSYLTNIELKTKKHLIENTLRLEIAYSHHIVRYLDFDTINGLIEHISSIKSILTDVVSKISYKPHLDYTLLSESDILLCEAYNNIEFDYNTKILPKNVKASINRKYDKLIKKYPESDYAKISNKFIRRINTLS